MKIETHIDYGGTWIAIDDDSYDGGFDYGSEFDGPARCRIYGSGATEQEAINDLIFKLEEWDEFATT